MSSNNGLMMLSKNANMMQNTKKNDNINYLEAVISKIKSSTNIIAVKELKK